MYRKTSAHSPLHVEFLPFNWIVVDAWKMRLMTVLMRKVAMSRPTRFCSRQFVLRFLISLQILNCLPMVWAQNSAAAKSDVERVTTAKNEAGESSAAQEKSASTQQIDMPLHARIDQFIESVAVGPLAPRAGDADFLRRIYLDLTGEIPSPQKARQFLADAGLDKRQRLIDELLTSPEFARHMAVQFNVLILERRTEKSIKQQDWERYLYESIAANKPLDQLFRELVYAESSESGPHPATKFILNRDAEPNAVTREFGRLAFGMDLQCAQCHNHPLIDDYVQADYYGLFAFLNRTTTYTDTKTKLVGLSEKAEGEASFKSVFTGDGRENTFPRIPRGTTLFVEPRFAPGDEYLTKPEKDKAGVPKYSRREALARLLRDSDQFHRNLANRLWLLMFGRGIVHPIDFHHSANPPNNPGLLNLLAHELKQNGFQIRPILRQIALSRGYQRTCDEPAAETINFTDIAARATDLRSKVQQLEAKIEQLKKESANAATAFTEAFAQHDKLVVERNKLEKNSAESHKKLDQASAAKKAAEESYTRSLNQAQAVNDASAATSAAASKLPDDKVVAEVAAKLNERAKQLTAASIAAKKSFDDKAAQFDAAQTEFKKFESEIAVVLEKIGQADKLSKLESAQLVAVRQVVDAQYELSACQWRLELCVSLGEYATLRYSDEAKAQSTWQTIVQRWEIGGQLAPLKALTSEQLAFSVLQATGNLDAHIQTLNEKLDKTPPEQLKNGDEANKPKIRNQLTQLQLLDTLRDSVGQFVTHYGGMPGEDFQATVNQALFFGNGGTVDSWLKPAGSNLSARLGKLDNADDLADELYVAVFSRHATEAEKQEITQQLKDYSGEREHAIRELIWAMLSSNEFRFNH